MHSYVYVWPPCGPACHPQRSAKIRSIRILSCVCLFHSTHGLGLAARLLKCSCRSCCARRSLQMTRRAIWTILVSRSPRGGNRNNGPFCCSGQGVCQFALVKSKTSRHPDFALRPQQEKECRVTRKGVAAYRIISWDTCLETMHCDATLDLSNWTSLVDSQGADGI